MAAFTSYHHPPFLVDSVILPPKHQTPINGHEILPLPIMNFDHFDPLSNMQVCDEDGFSLDHASGIQSSSVEQQSGCCEKQRTDSFASMAESVEQNTNNLGIVDKKRKIGNGFSSNSKDVVKQVKSKKEKADKEGIKDEKKDTNQGTEQPPEYIHVRAKRGQATDSHSLAERVRREKISERMKTLQALVPGCDKVTGKAMMLDEIINYVRSLQNQVEFLSMKLASLDPMVYTFGLMDNVDALPIRFQGLLNNMGSPPLPPLVQLPTTTTSSTSGSGTQPIAFPDANAVVSFNSTAAASAPTTTTFPSATVDSLARLIQQEQKLLLPTQEGSSHWPWGVLDEEQRQSNNIINHFSLGSNTNNLYIFHY